jgi:hypothetical protein
VETSVGSSGDDASTAKVEEDNDERDDMVRPLVEALCGHVLTLSRASLYLDGVYPFSSSLHLPL